MYIWYVMGEHWYYSGESVYYYPMEAEQGLGYYQDHVEQCFMVPCFDYNQPLKD